MEHIFRGKEKSSKEWAFGSLVEHEKKCYIGKYIPEYKPRQRRIIGGIYFVEVDPETVGIGTGQKDKNWHEIFTGDIIELINAAHKKIKVVCEFGTARREIYENIVDITGFYFKLQNGRKTFPIVNNYLGKHDLEMFEIIGNVHDNPELLGEV